jgi:arylsulfatase A-like enzyme
VTSLTTTAEAGDQPRPGVILICVDTLRADRLHCYGHSRETSPWIDRMAAGGVLFEQASSQANWSLPSYSSLFTSRYPPSLRARELSSGGVRNLAEVFRACGYATAGFVSGGCLSPGLGFAKGFDTYDSTPFMGSFSHTVPAALDWLAGVGSRPFFLVVHGYDVHGPYLPPLGFGEMYDPGYRGLVHQPGFLQPRLLVRVQDGAYEAGDLAAYQPSVELDSLTPARRRTVLPPFDPVAPPWQPTVRSIGLSPTAAEWAVPPGNVRLGPGGLPFELPALRRELSKEEVEHLRAHYDGAVTYTDTWLGVFFRSLESSGLASSAVCILLGDHGEDLGEHGRFDHGLELYNNLLHVPLIVSGPGLARGRRVERVVELLDVGPTLLDLCGIPPAHWHRGRSLSGLLREPSGEATARAGGEEPAAFAFDPGQASIRTARWHLIRKTGAQPSERLFDLVADHLESLDVSGSNPGEVSRLRGRLLELAEEAMVRERPDPASLSAEERSFMSLMGYW